MDSRKSRKIRPAQRQKFSIRLVMAAGISAAVFAIVFIIYFQFFQNEIIRAKNIDNLTQDNLPAELNIESLVTSNTDTLISNGNRYKIARPVSQTPALPAQ